MKITPEQFAKILKSSTLNAEEQMAVLNLLPKLTIAQIDQLAMVFEKDNTQQEIKFKTAISKRNETLLRLGIDLKAIEKELG